VTPELQAVEALAAARAAADERVQQVLDDWTTEGALEHARRYTTAEPIETKR
jgi:hypothetical protein